MHVTTTPSNPGNASQLSTPSGGSVRLFTIPENKAAMTATVSVRSANDPGEWKSCPIKADWILEGTPTARVQYLSVSADKTSWTSYWDCTAGRFNWFYAFDETLHIIEGGFTLKDLISGTTRTIGPGDVVYLPKGARTEWNVQKYVRKVAFCRGVLPPFLVTARDAAKWVRSLAQGKNGQSATQGGFSPT